MSEKTIACDIVIIGAGIAGCISAISLSQNYNVVLIDKDIEPKKRIGESLAPAAKRILRKLNLEENFNAAETHLINHRTQSYWGSHHPFIMDHFNNPDGNGWYLHRKEFELSLRNAAKKKGVHCIWPAHFINAKQNGNQWEIVAKSDLKNSNADIYNINTTFVIDASGRPAHFAQQQKIERITVDKLVSCWATLPNDMAMNMNLISSDKDGWWYSSPLPQNEILIAYQTDADLIERSMYKDASIFIKQAQQNAQISEILKDKLHQVELQGVVAANSSKLKTASQNQWAALGDAAISLDPLSSQGMYNAMANAMQLSELFQKHQVIQKLRNHNSINDFYHEYNHQIDAVWQNYLYHKKTYYGQEKRWKENTFWKRRSI